MEFEFQFNQAQTVTHYDAAGFVPTSATLTLYNDQGVSIQTPAVTVPTASQTLTSNSTPTTLSVADASAFSVGDSVAVIVDGETFVEQIVTIETHGAHDDMNILSAIPVSSANLHNATVKALKMTATVTALGIGNLGSNWQLSWAYNDGVTYKNATYAAHVVRWPWQLAFDSNDVAELLATVYGTERSLEFCREVARRIDGKIRNAIDQTGRRPFLFLSPSYFREVAETCARWILADMGIFLVGGDVTEFLREYRFAFNDELTKVIRSLKAYDSDNDGKISAAEAAPSLISINTTR